MEKTNLSKRVVAGTLALLTVFGSAPASLQGVFAPSALTASAAATDPYDLEFDEEAIQFVSSVTAGTSTYSNDSLRRVGNAIKIAKGDSVTIKSSVPLNFEQPYGTSGEIAEYRYAGNTNDIPDAMFNAVKDSGISQKISNRSAWASVPTTGYKFTAPSGSLTTGTYDADSKTFTYNDNVFTLYSAGNVGYDSNENGLYTTDGVTYYKLKNDDVKDNLAEGYQNYVKGGYYVAESNIDRVIPNSSFEANSTTYATNPEKQAYFFENTSSGTESVTYTTYKKWTVNSANKSWTLGNDYLTVGQETYYTGPVPAYETIAAMLTTPGVDLYKSTENGSKEAKTAADINTLNATVSAFDNINNYYAVTELSVGTTDGSSIKKQGSAGNYTYTFTAPSNTASGAFTSIAVGVEKQEAYVLIDRDNGNTIPEGLKTGDGEETTGVDNDLVTTGDDWTTATSTTIQAKTNTDYNAQFIKDSTVKVEADEPFKVTINDRNDNNNFSIPSTTFDPTGDGKFVCTFTMPTNDDLPIQIRVKKTTESFTYTEQGQKIIAKSESVNDAEAASISAFYYKAVEKSVYDADTRTAGTFAEKSDKYVDDINPEKPVYYVKVDIPTGTTVETGTRVYFAVNAAAKLATFEKFEYGTEGTTLTNVLDKENIGGVVVNEDRTSTGKFEAKLTVKEANDNTKSHTASVKFEIKTPEKLTADNVKLNIAFDGIANAPVQANDISAKAGETAEFVLQADGAAAIADKTFTVTPTIYKSATKEGETLTADTDYKITGYVSGSTVNNDYKFTVNVDSTYYGKYTFDVTWKLSSYVSTVYWKPAGAPVDIALEDIDTLASEVYKSATEGAKTTDTLIPQSEVEFEYVLGTQAAGVGEDELDDRQQGLPKEEGEYTVYVISDGSSQSAVPVTIGKKIAVDVVYDKTATSLTFGDQIDLDAFKLVEKKSGKEADKSNVKLQIAYIYEPVLTNDTHVPVENANPAQIQYWRTQGANPETITSKYNYSSYARYTNGYLNAGTYIVRFEGIETPDANGNRQYTTSLSEEFILTVAPKTVTADMISFKPVEISTANLSASGYDIVENSKTTNKPQFFDQATGVAGENKAVVTEGTQEKAVGGYDCKVKVTDPNYTGTTNAKWYIVDNAGNQAQKIGDVNWTDKTTIYDNGRMHFEVKRNADDKIVDPTTGEKLTVKEFGIIIDKTGKFEKMAGRDDANHTKAIGIAEQYLVYGNGYATGSYTVGDKRGDLYDASKQQVFKVNIKAQDTKTNIYARPFIVITDKDGNDKVYYGTTIAKNLTDVATEVFGLTCANEKDTDGINKVFREKDLDRTANSYTTDLAKVQNGYDPRVDKFYAYAQFTDLNKLDNGKEFKVTNFGVIIDKTGDLQGKIEADNTLDTPEKKIAKANEELVLKGKYQVGKYNPNNKYLKNNQFAANITPKDSVTGFWVRAYLDLGNDLIVYTDAHYYKSASEYYKSQLATAVPVVTLQRVGQGTDYKMKATVAAVTPPTKDQIGYSSKLEFKKKGVVLEKTGLYNENNKNSLIIGSADSVQSGSSTKNENYSARFTPILGTRAYVRPYVVYTIDGTDVTIYGEPKFIEFNKNGVPVYA